MLVILLGLSLISQLGKVLIEGDLKRLEVRSNWAPRRRFIW